MISFGVFINDRFGFPKTLQGTNFVYDYTTQDYDYSVGSF